MPSTQRELVSLFKVWLDILGQSERAGHTATATTARRNVMRLLADNPGKASTKYVMHNIGVKRRRQLMEFLSGTKVPY